MSSDDLLESLLAVCAPSEAQRRDDALVKSGERPSSLADARRHLAAVGLQAAPVEPSPALRARLLASATRPGRFGRYADRVARLFGIPVDTAAQLLASIEDAATFRPSGIPGVDLVRVSTPAYPTALSVLARIEPGARFPAHAHRGDETMLILAGGLREEGGAEAWCGDELYRADGTSHSFVALLGEPCFAAVLVEGTLELL